MCSEGLKVVLQRSSVPEFCEHRLVWSPHVLSSQEEEEEEPEICHLVVTNGCEVRNECTCALSSRSEGCVCVCFMRRRISHVLFKVRPGLPLACRQC